MSEKLTDHGPFLNTDRELWREPPGDYYASSVHVTESGQIGINVGGMVFVKSLRQWHEAAKDHAAAEERGRRSGVEEAAKIASGYTLDPEARNVHPDIAFKDMSETARMIAHTTAQGIAMAILDLAPRDSGKVEVCRAEVASRMPDYSHYECTLPKGHSGAHREGGAEWTDKDTVIA